MIPVPDDPPEWIGLAILLIALSIVLMFAIIAMKG